MSEMPCPTPAEYEGHPRPDAVAHAAGCFRCRVLIHALALSVDLGDAARDERPSLRALRRPDDDFTVACGDVCAALAPDVDERLICVVLTVEDFAIEVVPISDDTRMATDRDLLLDADILGFRAMAEAWNVGTLLIEEIDETITAVDRRRWNQLCALVEAVEDAAQPDEAVPVGPPIVGDDDPRWQFHVLEADRVRPYFQGASALRDIASIGELFRRQIEEERMSVPELSERLGPKVRKHESWIHDLAASKLDVGLVPAEAMSDLLVEIKAPATRQVAAIIANTLRQANGQPVAEAKLIRAFRARRRRRDNPDEAAAYAAAVVSAMADRQRTGGPVP